MLILDLREGLEVHFQSTYHIQTHAATVADMVQQKPAFVKVGFFVAYFRRLLAVYMSAIA